MGKGGGLYVATAPGQQANLYIQDTRVTNNSAQGGSILASPGSGPVVMDVRKSRFADNLAYLDGGFFLGSNTNTSIRDSEFTECACAYPPAHPLNHPLTYPPTHHPPLALRRFASL